MPDSEQRAADRSLHQKPEGIKERANLDAAIDKSQKDQVSPQQQLAHRHQDCAFFFISTQLNFLFANQLMPRHDPPLCSSGSRFLASRYLLLYNTRISLRNF